MKQIVPSDLAINILGFSAKIDNNSVESLVATISSEERQRAELFRSKLDQAMFICSRSVLRRIFSIQLGFSPQNVPIVINEFGKPCLQGENCKIEFSISHSSGSVLIAFTFGRKLGVDLEQIS